MAYRSARSITQRLDDYWLGLRLQKMDIPAINLLRTGSNPSNNDYMLTDALDLYLQLKGIDKDKTFIRTAHRNIDVLDPLHNVLRTIGWVSGFKRWISQPSI